MKRFSFPKRKRLVSSSEFKAVLDRRLRACGGMLTVYTSANECGYARLGVSVAKSCGGAVGRNHVKRLIREAFRLSQAEIPPGYDYVVMVSPGWIQRQTKGERLSKAVKELSLAEVKAEFEALVRKAMLREPQQGDTGEKEGAV